jgi:DNA-binding NarL/FixJ family response regulator
LVVIDNDRAVVDLLRLDLELEGHNIVATADNGEDAVRICDEHAPDVLVVDLRLGPGMNGLEVARQMQMRRPGLRIVLFTNYINPVVVRGAAELGVAVIEKGNLHALRRAITG